MKRYKIILVLAVLAVSTIVSSPALARRGHAHFGVFIGPGWYPPHYYYPPYYYPPAYYPYSYYPPVVSAPPTYVEQGVAQSSTPALASGYWYYCNGADAYYPYVRECPGGWQRVAPQPAR